MTREEKHGMVAELTELIGSTPAVYLADASTLNAESTSNLRRECFKKDVKMRVVKNTLLKLAMDKVEGIDYSPLYEAMAGPTAVMLSEVGNVPAKLIKEFRKKHDRPILKGAYVEEGCYVGDDQLEMLTEIKSKDELLGELIGLLQSPAKNVVSALQSGGSNLSGLLKALEERG